MIALLKSMRPRQWTKNAFVFAALIFDQKLFVVHYFLATLAAFVIFCFLSSAVYIINDLADVEKDRQHPAKKNRPIASGQLSVRAAMVAGAVIPLVCLPLAFALNTLFGLVALGYFAENLLYSFRLKRVVIVDVMMIALGFVLRVAGGVVLVDVQRFSPWLYVCMTLLALFLGLGKRRQEIVLMGGQGSSTRTGLGEYSITLLDNMIGIVTATTVMAYSLYTFSARGLPINDTMMLTIPFVLYGIFRYLYLIHVRGDGGAPDELLLRDRPLQVAVALWGLTAIVIMYGFNFPLRP
ncbi:MAG: decaprenyl-phosphate phosphoribosyltransferase [Chloroflexi bacterium]|nr:decaprenyl-phosphate phosphoribosyltransferase [Chloroflexota bacterium]